MKIALLAILSELSSKRIIPRRARRYFTLISLTKNMCVCGLYDMTIASYSLARPPSLLAHCAIDNERGRTDGRPDRRMASNSSNFKGGNGSRLRNCCTRTTPNTSASGAALLDLPSSTQVVTFMYRARLKAGPRFA